MEQISFGGTPGLAEKPAAERITQELKLKLCAADAGKLEAFWSVDIQRNEHGGPVPTVTVIADENNVTDEQCEAIRRHLWGIADVLRDIYRVI